jgi:hypothetical protein
VARILAATRPNTGVRPRPTKAAVPPGAINRAALANTRAKIYPARVSGTGSEDIGAITEQRSVLLEWATARPGLQIFTANGFLLVASNLSRGEVHLAGGHYPNVRVASKGDWTIQIHPTGSAPTAG